MDHDNKCCINNYTKIKKRLKMLWNIQVKQSNQRSDNKHIIINYIRKNSKY